jgi:hypothetical protein
MWKLVFAVLLVLLILVIYTDQWGARHHWDRARDRAMDSASALVGTTPAAAPAATQAPAPAPAAAPVAPADQPKKEGFCPKLMQKYGFCNAGESMNPQRGTFYDSSPMAALPTRGLKFEGMSSRVLPLGDVASQTQWGGNMGRSVLPNF